MPAHTSKPGPGQSAVDFLKTRRSHPAKSLTHPAPDHTALGELLTMSARTPDNGKLAPWRFIALEGAALTRLADLTQTRGAALGIAPDTLAKSGSQFGKAPLVVAVISSPKPNAGVAQSDQEFSAAAVCLSLLNAALASGWGAAWLSGWMASDREFLSEGLGLAAHEITAGYLIIGTASRTPSERPRPDIDQITTWVNT